MGRTLSEAELAKAREWKANNKERVKAARAAYYAAHKEKELAMSRAWWASHPEEVRKLRDKENESRRTDEYRERSRVYRGTRIDIIRASNRAAYHGDIRVRLRVRLTTLLNQALRRYEVAKVAPLMELVGCSMGEFIRHMESKFKPGMSWDEVSRIHIDHVRPISSFDWADPEQQRSCFHHTNLQPLWDHENRAKGSKYYNSIPSS